MQLGDSISNPSRLVLPHDRPVLTTADYTCKAVLAHLLHVLVFLLVFNAEES